MNGDAPKRDLPPGYREQLDLGYVFGSTLTFAQRPLVPDVTMLAEWKPDAAVKPMADLTLAMGPLMRWFGYIKTESSPAEAAGFAAAADFADGQKSALVRMLARPIERGVSMELTADAGAIRTVTASTRPPGAAAPAFPATGGPDPIPFPVPVR